MGILIRAGVIVVLLALEGAAYYLLFRKMISWDWELPSRKTHAVLALPAILAWAFGYNFVTHHWFASLLLLSPLVLPLGSVFIHAIMWILETKAVQELRRIFWETGVKVRRW